MIRKMLTRKQCSSAGEVIGTISVMCNLNASGIETRLMQILDHAVPKILGSSRFALEENFSTLMITTVGVGTDIRELVNSIRKLKGVIQAEFVITSFAACNHNSSM